MSEFFSLKVSQIEQLTDQSVHVSFEIPESLKAAFAYKAGQYITLKQNIRQQEVRRAYSIATAPSEPLLGVGIKQVQGGLFSTYANEALRPGDTLEVMPPQGRFVFDPNGSAQHIAGIAAGSGITPILSIAKTVLESHPECFFMLIYGNKTKDDQMYTKAIDALKDTYGERLKIEYVYSRASIPRAHFGRIDRSIINFAFKNKFADRAFDAFYLCGPEEMIQESSEALQVLGVSPDLIQYELFTSSKKEEAPNSLPDGMTQVHVLLDEVSANLEMKQTDRLLDALLKNKIDAPYSCQGGVCSSCIARVTKGSAVMIKNEILTNNEIAEGLILTCQAHPTSSEISIDFDDV